MIDRPRCFGTEATGETAGLPNNAVYVTTVSQEQSRLKLADTVHSLDHIAIVIPVLDDWFAFEQVLSEISRVSQTLAVSVEIIAIDDGSRQPFAPEALVL